MLEKFGCKQIFSIFLHRSHGTFSYYTKSHQLPSDGEVRTLVRAAVPYELQEEVRLDIVQPDPCSGR